MKKIIWVDEDQHLLEAERDGLMCFGYDVMWISNANLALKTIQSMNDLSEVKILILDVILLAGEFDPKDEDKAIYPSNTTGIELAEKLVEAELIDGKKIVFFSCASDNEHIADVEKAAAKLKATYLPKIDKYYDLGLAIALREAKLI